MEVCVEAGQGERIGGPLQGLRRGSRGEVDDLFSEGGRVEETLDDGVAVAGARGELRVGSRVEWGVWGEDTMCFQTVEGTRSAGASRKEGGIRTYVLKAEELVAAVGAQRASVGQQLL